jgi:hypothetical protein
MAAPAESAAAPASVWAAPWRPITVGLVVTITLAASEALAVATVLPLVARDLHGLSLYGWVTGAFFLGTLVGLVVGGGRPTGADRRRRSRPRWSSSPPSCSSRESRRRCGSSSSGGRCRGSAPARSPPSRTRASAARSPTRCGRASSRSSRPRGSSPASLSSALQLSDNLGVALGAGAGGRRSGSRSPTRSPPRAPPSASRSRGGSSRECCPLTAPPLPTYTLD